MSATNSNTPAIKLLLLLPDAGIHKLKIAALNISFREAPLTLTTLAALIPKTIKTDICLIDESVDTIPYDCQFDLVAISCITGTCLRAYKIARHFKKQGATIVLGGVHVTLLPEEAKQHADAIVTGFAEETWPQLLHDFAAGRLQPVYTGSRVNIKGMPEPRRDLQRKMGYMMPNTVFATRGCKGKCDFCSVPAAHFGWHTRPVGEVIDEISRIRAKRFIFNDVSLIEDREFARELFTALIPLKKNWGGLATTRIVEDPELLELMRLSGCIFLLLGFESIISDSLASMGKRFNSVASYKNVTETLHRHGIVVQGCFLFGLDSDHRSVFADTVAMVNELKIDIPRYSVYTPYPGTPLFRRLEAEGRILHKNWQFYDTQHVVFQPANMSPQELNDGFIRAYEQTFTLGSIVKRTAGTSKFPITALGNLAYWIYISRLRNEEKRFPDGCDR
jgi:radical SAM superfamily enzyme YgiQ (UPF0313 family)